MISTKSFYNFQSQFHSAGKKKHYIFPHNEKKIKLHTDYMMIMNDEIFNSYLKAGKIAAQVREQCKEMIKVGSTFLNVAELIENRIRELGGEIAFPVNISVNNIAAHFTPDKEDTTVFNQGDVVKVDIGVHVNGYIGDTTITIDLGDNKDLSKASQDALAEAIKIIKPGVNIGEIGNVIEQTIKKYGFKPIANLTGHGLDKYDLHAEPQIPNIRINTDYVLKQDQVIAIEPFATTGSGFVKESETILIFRLIAPQPVRNFDARNIIRFGEKRNGLPFAKRWLNISDIKSRIAIRELVNRGALYEYPILKDIEGSKISQFEHTIIVRDEPVVTTKDEEG